VISSTSKRIFQEQMEEMAKNMKEVEARAEAEKAELARSLQEAEARIQAERVALEESLREAEKKAEEERKRLEMESKLELERKEAELAWYHAQQVNQLQESKEIIKNVLQGRFCFLEKGPYTSILCPRLGAE